MTHALSSRRETKGVVNSLQREKSLAHLLFFYCCLQDLALFSEFHHSLPFKESLFYLHVYMLKFPLIYQKASFNL